MLNKKSSKDLKMWYLILLKAYRNKTLSDVTLVESNFVESHTLDIVKS